MSGKVEILKRIRAAFETERRINLHHSPIETDFNEGTVTLTGMVENVAAKKLALELAAAIPGVTGIVDRLTVVPATEMEDGEIRDHLRNALLEEPAFRDCMIQVQVRGRVETIREPAEEVFGNIAIMIENGSVLLEGKVPSLSHKRLAGVLAWWIPGSTNVLNCLEVLPPEEDNDDEVTDAVRLVLEKDPFVNADQIQVRTRNYVVTLDGLVPNEKEKEMAEFDGWYVFGVDMVVNRIEVSG